MSKVVNKPLSERISFRTTSDIKKTIEKEILPILSQELGEKIKMSGYMTKLIQEDLERRNLI